MPYRLYVTIRDLPPVELEPEFPEEGDQVTSVKILMRVIASGQADACSFRLKDGGHLVLGRHDALQSRFTTVPYIEHVLNLPEFPESGVCP